MGSREVSWDQVKKGVIAGSMVPNTFMLAPICSITRALIDLACEALDYALTAVDQMCDA